MTLTLISAHRVVALTQAQHWDSTQHHPITLFPTHTFYFGGPPGVSGERFNIFYIYFFFICLREQRHPQSIS